MRRLGEILEEMGFTGDYVPLRDLVDKEIIIAAASPVTTRFGESYQIAFSLDGQPHRTLASSDAIKDKLSVVQDELPLLAKVVTRKSKSSGNMYFDLE